MMHTPCCNFLRRGEESLSHPLYGWLLQHCTDHVCNETFTATIVFIFKKNRGEIPPPNMTSLHWQIMCSAPLQKMAEFFFLFFVFFFAFFVISSSLTSLCLQVKSFWSGENGQSGVVGILLSRGRTKVTLPLKVPFFCIPFFGSNCSTSSGFFILLFICSPASCTFRCVFMYSRQFPRWVGLHAYRAEKVELILEDRSGQMCK